MSATTYNMLIIDPQNDFHETFINENQIEEPGNLAVPGATADSARIAGFITNNRDKINKIFVSLDTHTKKHIGHPGYWESADDTKSEPHQWTFFSVNDQGKIEGRDAPLVAGNGSPLGIYTPKQKIYEDDKQYNTRVAFTTKYIEQMQSENNLKGQALIWPTHCLEGKPGHEVNATLRDALQQYDNSQGRLEYHIKGQNELVEMYSIFQAEIPMEDTFGNVTEDNMNLYYSGDKGFKSSSKINKRDTDREDGAYLQTSFNEVLFKSLTEYGNPIVICGEALSHCVNWSLRDLVTNILKKNTINYANGNKLIPGQVILLANCSSPVTGFGPNVDALMQFCKDNGVTIKYVDNGQIVDVKPAPTQGGTRKRRRHKNRRTKSKPKRSKKTHNRKPRHRRRTRK